MTTRIISDGSKTDLDQNQQYIDAVKDELAGQLLYPDCLNAIECIQAPKVRAWSVHYIHELVATFYSYQKRQTLSTEELRGIVREVLCAVAAYEFGIAYDVRYMVNDYEHLINNKTVAEVHYIED